MTQEQAHVDFRRQQQPATTADRPPPSRWRRHRNKRRQPTPTPENSPSCLQRAIGSDRRQQRRLTSPVQIPPQDSPARQPAMTGGYIFPISSRWSIPTACEQQFRPSGSDLTSREAGSRCY